MIIATSRRWRRSTASTSPSPETLGGSEGREDATGRGGYYCLRRVAKVRGWKPSKMTVAIQGFGNAGQHLARLLDGDGWRVVAVSDSRGAVYKRSGLDVADLLRVKQSGGSVTDAESCTPMEQEELLELDVDVLAPAALEDAIGSENAPSIRAKVILELANGPVSSEADEILSRQGVMVVPDIPANAGGVICSYFEWVQNRTGLAWKESDVHDKLEAMIGQAFDDTYIAMQDMRTDMRTAAYVHALERLSRAIEAHGTQRLFGNGASNH